MVIGSSPFVPPFGRASSVIGWVPHDPWRGAISRNSFGDLQSTAQPGSTSSPDIEAYMLWLAKHEVNVSRKLILAYDKTTGTLSIKINFTVLEAFIDSLKNITLTYRNVSLDTSQISLEELYELLQSLNLTLEEIKRLLDGETIVKDLGTSIEIMTVADDPPHWCDWGYPAPQWTWSRHEVCLDPECVFSDIYYIAEDPINLIFKLYPPSNYDEYSFLHTELDDKTDGINDQGTDDDWPEPNFESILYVYDCHNGVWERQDNSWIEGDDEIWSGRDEYDRMHIRLWSIYSPTYGYVVMANVHLEKCGCEHPEART